MQEERHKDQLGKHPGQPHSGPELNVSDPAKGVIVERPMRRRTVFDTQQCHRSNRKTSESFCWGHRQIAVAAHARPFISGYA
jgi:hypothetical protein